ncbi:putative nuclear export factor [Blattamonas nauphoetae]|uniref:Nuclear export factor n=1 Tax=Blattamonas nauphoetae TaxID=2049346 RepID=A0ABQ9XRE3_9EUKA|nr:putative nuclear export factor [Blattamonas nauphoetae]
MCLFHEGNNLLESSIPDTISKVKRGRSSRHSSQSRGPPKIGKKKSLSKTPPEEDHKIEERAERFKQDYRTELRKRAESRASLLPTPESVNTEGPILGRCTKLEKKYLRLTGAPDPDTVRPLPILKKAFEMVRQRWSDGTDYEWVCEQLMSIRQDLTVQHLGETEFAVCVYESHARIAISSNDLSEYNRCQTMLSKLYRQGIKGCVMEFTSYQLLYWLCTGDSASFTLYLRQLSPRARSHSFILLPLSLFQVLQSQNWVRFHSIRARVEADARPVQKTPKPPPQFPPLARLFMQRFEETFRTTGFATLCTTIKPSLHLHDATTTLGFCSANVDPSHSELNECFSWLVSKRATFVPPVSNPRHVNLSSPPALDTVQSYASALASTKPVLSVSSSPDPSLSPQNDGSGYDSAPDRTYGVSPSPTPEKGGTRANTIGQKTLDITAMLRKKK